MSNQQLPTRLQLVLLLLVQWLMVSPLSAMVSEPDDCEVAIGRASDYGGYLLMPIAQQQQSTRYSPLLADDSETPVNNGFIYLLKAWLTAEASEDVVITSMQLNREQKHFSISLAFAEKKRAAVKQKLQKLAQTNFLQEVGYAEQSQQRFADCTLLSATVSFSLGEDSLVLLAHKVEAFSPAAGSPE